MYGWIDAKQFSFNTLLLMDRWIIRYLAKKQDSEFTKNFAIALAGNPAVLWYAVNKCPEQADYFLELAKTSLTGQTRDAETYVLDAIDWAVVYVYPEIMESLPYIKDWDPQRLLEMADFRGKTVLDIGRVRAGWRSRSSRWLRSSTPQSRSTGSGNICGKKQRG